METCKGLETARSSRYIGRQCKDSWSLGKDDTNLSNVTVYALAKLYDIEVDQIKV